MAEKLKNGTFEAKNFEGIGWEVYHQKQNSGTLVYRAESQHEAEAIAWALNHPAQIVGMYECAVDGTGNL